MQIAIKRIGITAFIAMLLSCTLVYAQGTWSTESSIGFSPRAGLVSVVVDGKIYAIGGANEATFVGLSTFEVFDPITNSWSTPATTGTFTPRYSPAAVMVDHKIYVMGGYVNSVASNAFEVFDTRTNEWTTPVTTGTFTPRKGMSAVLYAGKIYVIGGNDNYTSFSTLEVFDPVSNTWSTPATTGTFSPRYAFATALVDGKIYAFGGWDYRPASGVNTKVNTLEVFDPVTNHWSTPVTTGTSTARSGVSAVVVSGKIYAIGNAREGPFLEVFDPTTNSWSTPVTGGMTTRRGYVETSLIGNKIYAIGGMNVDLQFLNTNESLTLETSAVGNAEPAASANILFPNPTRGSVSIRGESMNSRVVVSNALGERVIEIPSSRSGDISFDLSNLSAGRYFVSIASASGVTTRMIVRE